MTVFLIICFIMMVHGRPEAIGGYNYNRPPITHGGGLVGIGTGGGVNAGLIQQVGGNYHHQTGSLSSSSSSSSSSAATSFGNSGFDGGAFSTGGGGSNFIGHHQGALIGGNTISGGLISGSTGSGLSSFGSISASGPTLIQKHIYVHVPPPEPEEFISQKQVSVGIPQKHYKIIFIKAPSAPSLAQQQIALSAQSQEKTIVYVLVKKPDDITDIAVPTIAPTQPSKPEVYFIKYKAKKTGGGGSLGGTVSLGSSGVNGILGATSIGSGSAAGIISSGISHGGGLISGPTSTGIGGIGGISSSVGAISSGTASSSAIGGIPAAQYGPPGKSGPY